MTTMHFVLAGARSATVYESVGRAGMYLTTVSMTLVALGFIGSATGMGNAFYVFAGVLLSLLILLGLVSFNRTVQTGVQDLRLSLNEAQILRFYAQAAPGIDQWFDHPVRDVESNHALLTAGGSRFQMLFTVGSMVGGVNSAVIGVLVGLAVSRLAGLGSVWAMIAGAVAFTASGWLHLRREYSMFAALPSISLGSAPVTDLSSDVVVTRPPV